MGTRSNLLIKDGKNKLLFIYRQMDGYPTGMGADIKQILANGEAVLVNGYGGDQRNPTHFNGMGCLAAYLVAKLKNGREAERNSIGSIYIKPLSNSSDREEYYYTVYNKDKIICLKAETGGGLELYDGPIKGFDPEAAEKLANSEEEED